MLIILTTIKILSDVDGTAHWVLKADCKGFAVKWLGDIGMDKTSTIMYTQ